MPDPYEDEVFDGPGSPAQTFAVPPPPGPGYEVPQQTQEPPGAMQSGIPPKGAGWVLMALCAAGGIAAGVMLKGEIDRWQRRK